MDARWSKLLDFVCATGHTSEVAAESPTSFDEHFPQFSLVESALLQFGTHLHYHLAFSPWAARGGMYRGVHPRSTKRWKPEPYVVPHDRHDHSKTCPVTKDGFVVIEKVMSISDTAIDAGRPCTETDEEWLGRYRQMKSRLRKLTSDQ